MKRFTLSIIVFFPALVSAPAGAANIDELIVKLVGADGLERARARQLLPREGVAAVPAVLPLLGNGDPAIADAAFDIIMDIGNQAAGPGHEAERRQATDLLMPLVAAERSETQKLVGLRLLDRLVPAGYDIGPIAKLFGETPLLRDRARTALERIGTEEARAALRAALPDAEPAFQWGLLTSLYELRDEKSLPLCRELTKSSDWRVRLRAARCLTWSGNPQEIPVIREVLKLTDEKSRASAVDSLLRLAYTLSRKPATVGAAREIYLEFLADTDILAQEGALAGLGRIGDGESVGPVLKTLDHTEARVRRGGWAALRAMAGKDVVRALIEAYPKHEKHRVELLALLANKHDAQVAPLLAVEVKSSDPAVRSAALQGLGQLASAEGLKPLKESVSSSQGEEKRIACESLATLASKLRARDQTKEAGEAFALLLSSVEEGSLQQRAIEGLAFCPVAEGFEGVMAATAIKDLAGPVSSALLAIGLVLESEGDKEKAIECFRKVIAIEASTAQLREAIVHLKKLGVAVEGLPSFGVITHWWVRGPFEAENSNRNWHNDLIGETKKIEVQSGEWKPVVATDDIGMVDLISNIAPCSGCIGYAYTEVMVDKETDALLQLGVDDGEKIWVNGEKVFENFVDRGMRPDDDQVPIHLKAGVNTILLKIWQNAGGWQFCSRLSTRDGRRLRFAQRSP